MKKLIITACAGLLALGAAAQDNGWKNPKTIIATIVERSNDQPEKKMDMVQKEGAIAYKTSASINGQLAGIPRVELYGNDGIYTWVEGKPELELQLFAPTATDVADFLVRPAFSRADLEFNLQGIEKTLGKKVLVGKTETVAGRDCLVLKVLDRPDTANTDFQKLWIDRETGITMRQQDWFNGKMTYEREIAAIDFRNNSIPAVFARPAKAVIVRGVVDPSTLLRVERLATNSEFQTDISKVNAAVKAPQTPWASIFDSNVTFGYAQTVSREIKSIPVSLSSPSNQNNQNNQNNQFRGRRRNQFGARGEHGLGAPQEVIQYSVATATTDEPRMLSIELDNQGNRRVIVGETLQSGDAGTNAQGIGDKVKVYPFIQSDFVDSKTGDTLTFMQTSGRAIEPSLGQLVLGQAKDVKDTRLEYAKAFTSSTPIRMNVLTWRRGEIRYALASTNLTTEQLVDLAAKVKRS